MKASWRNMAAHAKLAVIFAFVLLLSLGLCGVSIRGELPRLGVLSLVGILIGAVGLLAVGVAVILRFLFE
jgi:hypothetical protein